MACIARFLVFALLAALLSSTYAQEPELTDDQVAAVFKRAAAANPDPQTRAAFRAFSETNPSAKAMRDVLYGRSQIPIPEQAATAGQSPNAALKLPPPRGCKMQCKRVKCSPPKNPKIWDVNDCVPDGCVPVCDGN